MIAMINFLKRHSFIILLCAGLAALGATLIVRWFNTQLNPDAVSYITIAQKYASGDIAHAINGYWGPLLSILMVPFLWVHVDPIIAAKFVSLSAAIGTLVVVYWFLIKRAVSRVIVGLSCLALAAIMFTWFSSDPITPDTLFAFIGVLVAVLSVQFVNRPTGLNGALLGAGGATLYFTKGFGFFLFIGVAGLIALWQWLRQHDAFLVVVKRWLPVAIVFAVLAVPFITAISVKYHQFTINTAGAFDYRAYGYYGLRDGNFPPASNSQPMAPLGPPNSGAVSTWEDPTPSIQLLRSWSPLGSADEFWFFLGGVLGTNLLTFVNYIYAHGPVLILGFGALAIAWARRGPFRGAYAIFSLIALLTIIGYSLVFAEGRYLSSLVVLGVLVVALQASELHKKHLLSTTQCVIAGLLIFAVTTASVWQTVIGMKHVDNEWKVVSMAIGQVVPAQAKTMSDTFIPAYQTCYYLRLQCYNIIAPGDDTAAYDAQIKKAGVTYFIAYHMNDGNKRVTNFIAAYSTPIYDAVIDGKPITVYKVN